ncbi:MarR family winged helix-turn-helix transcriptional regulator [Eubacterium sp.]|uniref:MarR family winged helix-turn-helix transcriptional regulator n=1 Tax=Eubacterium sp. TaxID=142586 RepID=UPI003521C1AE
MNKITDKRKDCFYMIKQLHDNIEKNANNALKKYDLTMMQLGALMRLNKDGGGECTLKEFEKLLHLAQSTTAGIVKRLEQKKFVECFGDPFDKRIKKVRITGEGIKLCSIAAVDMEYAAKKYTKGISKEELNTFVNVIIKLCENADS